VDRWSRQGLPGRVASVLAIEAVRERSTRPNVASYGCAQSKVGPKSYSKGSLCICIVLCSLYDTHHYKALVSRRSHSFTCRPMVIMFSVGICHADGIIIVMCRLLLYPVAERHRSLDARQPSTLLECVYIFQPSLTSY